MLALFVPRGVAPTPLLRVSSFHAVPQPIARHVT
jgi:hypothetical protein